MTPRRLPLLTGPLRWPRLVLLIAAILCALSLWLATRSHATSSLQDLIGRNDPAARALRDSAAAIDAALSRGPEAAPLVRSITYAASPQLIDFFKDEAIPRGLYYLDDAEYRALLARLTPEAMREQLRQDEAMIAAP